MGKIGLRELTQNQVPIGNVELSNHQTAICKLRKNVKLSAAEHFCNWIPLLSKHQMTTLYLKNDLSLSGIFQERSPLKLPQVHNNISQASHVISM